MQRSEISAYLASKPLAVIRELASSLGWHGIQLQWCHPCACEETPTADLPLCVYYMTTDEKFNLQINEKPLGQARTYNAIVKAERYGIACTEWVDFTLPDGPASFSATIQRLRPLLHRENFKNRKRLQVIKQADFVHLTWSRKKPRGKGRRRGAGTAEK